MPPSTPLNPPAGTQRPRVPAAPKQPPPARAWALEGMPKGFQIADSTPTIAGEQLRLSDGTPIVNGDGYLIPPARTLSMVVNAATRVFSYRFDEAMRDNFVNARAMRRDAFIRGLLEERILPTINRKWQLEVDDDKHPDQKLVRDTMFRIVRATPQFDAFKRALLDATWFGRAGCQWSCVRNREIEDHWTLRQWDPVHGDSVQFTFDGKPAILMDAQTAGWYAQHGATRGPWGDLRSTDRGGMALVLQRPFWRDRFAIHQHMREKADFFEGELAGSVQGLGLRGLVYWHYVIRTEALTWMLTYMQAVGQMDLLVFNYPQGDETAKLAAETNARKIIGKAAIAVPRNPQGNWPAIEQIPMNDAGLKALHELISDYFDRHIERLIVGQSMSSGADNEDGLGGTGRAEFARATKDEILVYDTNRLDETLTTDLVRPLLRANFPWARFPVRYKSVMPDLEAKDKVANGQTLISAGVEIKVDEFREAAGYSRPEKGDETVGGQQPGMMPGMPGQPGAPGQPPGGMPGAGPGAQKPPKELPAGGPPTTFPRSLPPKPPEPGENPKPGEPAPHSRYEGTGPAMGFPGGGNTYIPSFGDPRRRDHDRWPRFTRYEKPAKLGCLLAPLSGSAMMAVLRAGSQIPDADLAPKGRETEPHVTVRYGFHHGVTDDAVAGVCNGFGPVELKLGRVSVFPADGHDVLKFEVESPALHRLHGKLAALPHTDTHPSYKPHATIAYLKPGAGRFHADRLNAVLGGEQLQWTVDDLDYRPAPDAVP